MLSYYTSRILTSSILTVILVIAGIWIHRTGKPYPVLIFGIHKVLTVVMIIILFAVVKRFLGNADPALYLYLLTGTITLCLTGLLISGSMMSLDKLQEPMLLLHRVSTAVFLLSYPAFIYSVIIMK